MDLLDPTHLEFEYVRWLGHLVDLMADPGVPLNVLHLGGGAWTLARYVAATRPACAAAGGRAGYGADRLRPRAAAGLGRRRHRVRSGEARQVLESLGDDSVDLIVVDVFSGLGSAT